MPQDVAAYAIGRSDDECVGEEIERVTQVNVVDRKACVARGCDMSRAARKTLSSSFCLFASVHQLVPEQVASLSYFSAGISGPLLECRG